MMGINLIYVGISIILHLVFIVSLLILTIRIKSIGLGLIFFTVLFGSLFRWVFILFISRFLFDRQRIGEIDSIHIYNFIANFSHWLIIIFCIIGVLLILNEWKSGKFNTPHS